MCCVYSRIIPTSIKTAAELIHGINGITGQGTGPLVQRSSPAGILAYTDTC